MTDEELGALVKRAMDRAIERLQKLHSHAGRTAWDQVICEELSEPFTTLRAQLAEAQAERDEAINQLDSARHSVDVLEKRVAHFMSRADRAEAAIREAIRLGEQPHYGDQDDALAHYGEAMDVLRAVLKGETK